MASEKALIALAKDVGDLKKGFRSAEDRLDHHSEVLEQLAKGQEELLAIVKQLQVATSSLASSVLVGVESAVFPPKH
jgi:hypothetical protein